MATGFDAYLADGGDVETLQEMYRSWPFFRTMVDNASLALAPTDMDIATAYAGLADVELGERFFPQIRGEYERSVELLARITGREDLPIDDWLVESMERRNPYVDPLNVLQVRLLDRDDRSPLEERTVRLTVKGIAAGMKNTG